MRIRGGRGSCRLVRRGRREGWREGGRVHVCVCVRLEWGKRRRRRTTARVGRGERRRSQSVFSLGKQRRGKSEFINCSPTREGEEKTREHKRREDKFNGKAHQCGRTRKNDNSRQQARHERDASRRLPHACSAQLGRSKCREREGRKREEDRRQKHDVITAAATATAAGARNIRTHTPKKTKKGEEGANALIVIRAMAFFFFTCFSHVGLTKP